MDVEEHGAAGVGGVGGMHLSSGQVPHQPRIDGAEGQLARFGALAGTGNLVQDPGDLAGGIVGVGDETRATCHLVRRECVGTARLHDVGGAPTLPHDGVVDGLAGGAVPHHRGLALVGYPYRYDLIYGNTRGNQQFGQHLQLAGEDVLGRMLNPARLGEQLRERTLRHAADAPFPIYQHRAG